MPRRTDSNEARVVQVSFLARKEDLDAWRAEAKRLGISLSRCLWLRAVRAQAPPTDTQREIAAQLPRLGVNLNQAVRRLHCEGASVEAVAELLQAVRDLQMRLVGA